MEDHPQPPDIPTNGSAAEARLREADAAELGYPGGDPSELQKRGVTPWSRATWEPYEKDGTLSERSDLPDSVFAFPKERKEPLTSTSHVRNAIARFDQVIDVSDAERDLAFQNIKKAAEHYGVTLSEDEWEDLGRKPEPHKS